MEVYKSKYSWRPGYKYKVAASVVGKVLEKIEEKDGAVSSKAFLEYSRPEDAETHSMFDWNDDSAAEKWRMFQARKIINQLEVEVIYAEEGKTDIECDVEEGDARESQKVTAFVNTIKKSTGAAYINILDAMRDDELRKQVVLNAYDELQSFARKYKQFTEFAGVIEEIEKVKIL